MGKRRFIEWQGQTWTLTSLAREHGLHPATLKSRLDVARLPLARALATGLCSKSEAGRRSAAKSTWLQPRRVYSATGGD